MSRIFIALSLAVFVACVPQLASAATFLFASPVTEVAVGATVQVAVVLDGAADEHINAVEGVLRYDMAKLALVDIRDGGSAVNIWVTSPVAAMHRDADGTVPFSGITPGGFGAVLGVPVDDLPAGALFVATFRGTQQGAADFAIVDAAAYVNDGLGTAAQTQAVGFQMHVIEGEGTVQDVTYDDEIPPEEFVPVIAQNPDAFEGKWFAVFQTVDKNSGIDHYTVQENGGEEVVAESPYVLADQSGRADVVVHAYDRAGNVREGTRAHAKFPTLVVCGILFVILVLIVLWRNKGGHRAT